MTHLSSSPQPADTKNSFTAERKPSATARRRYAWSLDDIGQPFGQPFAHVPRIRATCTLEAARNRSGKLAMTESLEDRIGGDQARQRRPRARTHGMKEHLEVKYLALRGI